MKTAARSPLSTSEVNPEATVNGRITPFRVTLLLMGEHRFLSIGTRIAQLLPIGASILAGRVLSPFPRDAGGGALTWLAIGLFAAFVLSVVVHELGHVLAIRLARRKPTAVHLLGPSHRALTFHIAGVPVRLGFKSGGRVEYPGDGLSVAQSATIAAAGPAADLVTAPLVLLLPIAHWTSVYIAVCLAGWGIANLIPARFSSGRLSDGAVLLQVRARARATPGVRELLADPGWSSRPDAARLLTKGWALDVPEAEECLKRLPSDRSALLEVYSHELPLPPSPETEYLNIVHALSWKVVARPSVPAELVDLASTRVEWVLAHADKSHPSVRARDVWHTLAVVRLRQGRPEEVRRLCTEALDGILDPTERATVLATTAIARHQLMLDVSARQDLHEALALDPSAQLVMEAASVLSRPIAA